MNPVERMLAVRPCSTDHPNAVRWTDDRGRGRWVSAKAFCDILFKSCGWDKDYKYKVPAIVRTKDEETVIFFDLDNYIGMLSRKKGLQEEPQTAEAKAGGSEDNRSSMKGIFYAPDDDEAEEVTDTEEMERRLQAFVEYEKRNFGTSAFEHDGAVRLPAIDDNGEWEIMAEALVIGDDHRVDEEVVAAMQDEMLEAAIASENPDVDTDPSDDPDEDA